MFATRKERERTAGFANSENNQQSSSHIGGLWRGLHEAYMCSHNTKGPVLPTDNTEREPKRKSIS